LDSPPLMRYILHMPALIHKRADGTQKPCALADKPLVVGRHQESEIQVRDVFISRRHASISHSNNTFILKDLGSTNGTYRNGIRVYECNLASGDKIQIGNAALVFEIDPTTGNAILRHIPPMATAPRQVFAPTASSAPLPGGIRPSELKTTIPVQILPPA
jgi:adenylate cyclase